MKKSLLVILVLVLALSTFLVACGKSEDKENAQGTEQGTEGSDNAGEPKEGGVITYAVDEAPEGLFDYGYYGSAIDAEVLQFVSEGMYTVNENLEYVPNLATWEESADHKVFTFKLKEGIKWHNGDPLTMEDWKYALEVIAHKDYTGPRYVNVEHIQGAAEYHEGKADSISGIKLIDQNTLEITFKEARINNLENLWPYPMPKKYYEGIAVKDLEDSPKIRQNPIGVGPFKVKNIVPGESVELVRFDDYWQGKPLLDGIIVKVIDPSLISGMLQSGEVDIMGIRPANVEELKNSDNVVVAETGGTVYSYIGFDFGHYDKNAGRAVMDNPKFQNKKLRQAIAYSLDRQALVEAFLNGKATVTNSPIPSAFWLKAPESELNTYPYDPEKAKSLLAEAGYKDVDGDGFVEDPEGKPFKILFSHYAGPSAFEGRAQAIMQNIRDIGINIELNTGALIDFNLYNDMKDNDDPSIELFFGSWGTGTDPDPTGLWHSTAVWNYGRYADETNDRLIEEGQTGENVFDKEWRKAKYIEWQKYFNEELPAIILWENMDLYGMTKRLQGVKVTAVGLLNPHKWWVTE